MTRRRAFFLALAALWLLRSWQVQKDLADQASLFPSPQKGHFRLWVREEPQVLFDRGPGSHDTGRSGGYYLPQVREVRAVCEAVALDGRPIPPVKLRAAFFPSPKTPQ